MQEEREQSDATERTEGDDGPVVLEEVAEATCSHSCPELDEGSERASKRVKFAAAPAEVAGKYDTEDGHCDEEGRGARPVRSTGRRQLTSVTPADIRLLEQELGEENRPSLDRLKRRVGLLPLRQMIALGWVQARAEDATVVSTDETVRPASPLEPLASGAAKTPPSVSRPGGLRALTFRGSH